MLWDLVFRGLRASYRHAHSFTTALQRVYLRAWRRPPRSRPGAYVRGPCWLIVMVASFALLGALRGALGNGLGLGVFAILSLAVTSALWWFTAWFLLVGEVRARVLIPTGVITGVVLGAYAASATIWMPNVVTDNESQFGVFGVALALVTWFSGAAICMLIGACAGPVFAEDTGWVGNSIRGGDDAPTLSSGAEPPLPPPARGPSLRDAFQSRDES